VIQIEVTRVDRGAIVKVTGRMEADNFTEFISACEKEMDAGVAHFAADLSELAYVSSMGLRSFLTVAQSAQKKGGTLALCGLKGVPRQVFEVTRLIGLFPVYDTTDEAVQHF
jgi:anti-sigma B factor antagonist